MQIIFLGGFFPEPYKDVIEEKSKFQIQNAANNFQWAFIKGLKENYKQKLKLISVPFIGWYPKYYKDIVIKKIKFNQNNEINRMVGFLNLPILKTLTKYFNLQKVVKNFLVDDDWNVIFVYSLDIVFLKTAINAKKKKKKTLICVIITDCYDYNESNIHLKEKFNNYIFKPILNNLLKKIDSSIVLTKDMPEYLNISSKPFLVIEGIYHEVDYFIKEKSNTEVNTKIVLYAGSLEYPYGIRELLDAFNKISDEGYKLWICGGGSAADLVIKRAQLDSRIIYFGIVSNEKVRKLQQEATLLINPRNNKGEFNRYSFPSKTIEYFASGTPTLLYRLEGIPEEYYNYCYLVNDNSIDSLAETIYNLCQQNSATLIQKGKDARKFILENKTSGKQGKLIISMIKQIIEMNNYLN